jgi:hypothetical protein
MELHIDPEFQSLIPALSDEERLGLEESLKREGCRDAIVVWRGIILDGHNRYEICERHGIEFQIIERVFDSREEAQIWIIENQISRRNLTRYARGELVLRREEFQRLRENARAQQERRTDLCPNSDKSLTAIDAKKELAKAIMVGHDTASRIIQIHRKATEKQKILLRKGELSINEVYKDISMDDRRIQQTLNQMSDLFVTLVIRCSSIGAVEEFKSQLHRWTAKVNGRIEEHIEYLKALQDREGARTPHPAKVLQLLPKSNCKECGEDTCIGFVMKLDKGETSYEKCPVLSESEEARKLFAGTSDTA